MLDTDWAIMTGNRGIHVIWLIERLRGACVLAGKMLDGNRSAATHNNKPLYEILKLSYITGPLLSAENHGRFVGEPASRLLRVHSVRHLNKMIQQQWNILVALAERGESNRKNIDTVIKVAAETALIDGGFKVYVRGGDDPDV